MESAPTASANRLQWVDTLRGFAACWVALFHFNCILPSEGGIYRGAMNLGWLGVIIFFVLSGFSIQLSLKKDLGVMDFLGRRFWRIYPAYLASLLFVIVLVIARTLSIGYNDFIQMPESIAGWMATFTLTTSPATTVPTVNWVYWSLTYEIAFYGLISLVLLHRWARWPVLIGTTLAALCFGSALHASVFFLDKWSLYGLGVAAAEWVRKRGILPVLLGLLCMADIEKHLGAPEQVAAFITTATILLCLSPRARWLNREPLFSRIGVVSYSLYLVHVPLGCWCLLRTTTDVRMGNPVLHGVVDIAALAACIGVAALSYHFIESAGIAYGRRRFAAARSARLLG